MSYRCITISDFNIANFNALLTNNVVEPRINTVDVPFGQVHQLLMDEEAKYWQEGIEVAVVWTRPHMAIPSFGRAMSFEEVLTDDVLREVDAFASKLTALKKRVKTVFVPSWVAPPDARGLGVFDYTSHQGVSNMVLRMNLRLADQLSRVPGIYMLDTSRWIQEAGHQAFSPKLWYMAKVAFGNAVLKRAAADVKSGLMSLQGGSKKLIVLDLDNTLWGGVVGEVGWEGINLGGHDPNGEAFVDFQRALKNLKRRGIILGIVSKNEESVAIDAIKMHPEMVLRFDDFAAWKINWQDKAQNLAQLVSELNLGLESVVFIDDHEAERARVRESLSEVFVPEWPTDPSQYCMALAGLSCFDTPTISNEDLQRTEMYKAERQRNAAMAEVGTLDDWLVTLETTVTIEPLSVSNLPRAAQLMNKTNQMNLTTRRMPDSELLDWSAREGVRVWTVHVSDRFGQQGLTGILSVEPDDSRLRIVDFILSCRVMGRRIEEAMLAVAMNYAKKSGFDGIDVFYKPTNKNRPCLEFFKRSGLRYDVENQSFHGEAFINYQPPEQVAVEVQELEEPISGM